MDPPGSWRTASRVLHDFGRPAFGGNHTRGRNLVAGHLHGLLVTGHVINEVSYRYPNQQRRFASALHSRILTLISVADTEELPIFASLSAIGHLGTGKCSTSAVAVQRGYTLAIDNRVANRQARRLAQSLNAMTTRELIV